MESPREEVWVDGERRHDDDGVDDGNSKLDIFFLISNFSTSNMNVIISILR